MNCSFYVVQVLKTYIYVHRKICLDCFKYNYDTTSNERCMHPTSQFLYGNLLTDKANYKIPSS